MRRFFIAGFGNTGESAAKIISRHFKEVYVIDKSFKFTKEKTISTPKRKFKVSYVAHESSGLKLIEGDALKEKLWKELSLTGEDTVIVALPDDKDIIFCVLIVKNLFPETTVIARANNTKNLEKIYRAGADYVAPLSSISAQTLAMSLLKGKEISEDVKLSYSGINIEKFQLTEKSKIIGLSLAEVDLRKRTGCTVIAVIDDSGNSIKLSPSTILKNGMTIVVAGKKKDILRLKKLI